MKVKFTDKSGKHRHLDIDYKSASLKVISLYGEPARIYSLSTFMADPMAFSVEKKNYQRFDYSDGTFEYREM